MVAQDRGVSGIEHRSRYACAMTTRQVSLSLSLLFPVSKVLIFRIGQGGPEREEFVREESLLGMG